MLRNEVHFSFVFLSLSRRDLRCYHLIVCRLLFSHSAIPNGITRRTLCLWTNEKKAYSRDPFSRFFLSLLKRKRDHSLYDWVAMRLFELTKTRTSDFLNISSLNMFTSKVLSILSSSRYDWSRFNTEENFTPGFYTIGHRGNCLREFKFLYSSITVLFQLEIEETIRNRSMFGTMFNCFQSIDWWIRPTNNASSRLIHHAEQKYSFLSSIKHECQRIIDRRRRTTSSSCSKIGC